MNVRSKERRGTAVQAARRERRRVDDRGDLLTAAERVFSARGYSGASIRQIAAEAGFSVGGVYQIFPGKEELFAAVLDAVWNEYLEMTHSALKLSSFAERLAALTQASGEFVARRRSFLAIVVSERAAIDGALGGRVGETLARHRKVRRRHLVELMKSGLAEGVLRFDNAEFLASAYLGLVTQCQTDALAGGRGLPSPGDVVSLFCRGATAAPRTSGRTSR